MLQIFVLVATLQPLLIFTIYMENPNRPLFLYSAVPVKFQNVATLLLLGIFETALIYWNWGMILFYLFYHFSYMHSSAAYLRHLCLMLSM